MPAILIGEYYKHNDAIFKAVVSHNGKKKLKEVLAFNSVSNKWGKGSGLAISTNFFKRELENMIHLSENEFKQHKNNEL
ncbi:MAG: hypothetical protein N4A35_05270 [Flavobacteriales bacterium]|jgi:hypothetical protein|nr:hypothetical protein [Flavobacteriales bacterium]